VDLTQITPDEIILWDWGWGAINATMAFTWAVMALLGVGSWLVTRHLTTGPGMSRWQNLLEVVVDYMRRQIIEIGDQPARRYLPFVGTLFVFIAVSNLLLIVPGFIAPTASLSTTAALALCVFVAVPIYGIAATGVRTYLRQYVQPTVFMLPFNVIGELTRTLALAVRLFGNVLSSTKIVAILLAVAPLIFPAVLSVLGLVTGLIQAYIFAVLAMVYIASGTRAHGRAAPGPTADHPDPVTVVGGVGSPIPQQEES